MRTARRGAPRHQARQRDARRPARAGRRLRRGQGDERGHRRQHDLTTIGVSLGTPAYMAPEQAAADPNIDHRADIYAVGVLAYEMLSGAAAVLRHDPQAILAAHITQPPDPLGRAPARVPPAIAQIVMRCLEKDPAERYQTADELLLAIEALATPSGDGRRGRRGPAARRGLMRGSACAERDRRRWVSGRPRYGAILGARDGDPRDAADDRRRAARQRLVPRPQGGGCRTGDTMLTVLWATPTSHGWSSIKTQPAGARVYRASMADTTYLALPRHYPDRFSPAASAARALPLRSARLSSARTPSTRPSSHWWHSIAPMPPTLR